MSSADVMKEHRIARLSAGGMTDAGMERVAGLDHVTRLALGNSRLLTDEGLRHLARMPQLQELELGGPTSVVTDRGLDALRHLWELRFFSIAWNQNISDAGVANLASCDRLERVDLMGTHTGDGGIRALAGKSSLRLLHTGRCVTDAGLMLLHRIPAFSTRASSETSAADGIRADLLLDGPFTNAGLATLSRLEGLSALSFFWHCSRFTGEGLAPLTQLPNLVSFGCEGERCDDAAMRHIGQFPRLRKLNAQGTVASDVGFESLSRSRTIENIWGRECPNLTGRGFAALSTMPVLRVLGVSCRRVDDAALSTLPRFPALTGFMTMDVPDEGFRHVGQCQRLETLTCMYCSDTGDAATEHIANLPKLKSYYAGDTRITDRSLEILSHMQPLERLEFWSCSGITDRGVGQLAALPRLREIVLDGLPNVTQKITDAFPSHVRVKYLG
jgi:hypothetical protein